jgi:hypothetical protein
MNAANKELFKLHLTLKSDLFLMSSRFSWNSLTTIPGGRATQVGSHCFTHFHSVDGFILFRKDFHTVIIRMAENFIYHIGLSIVIEM